MAWLWYAAAALFYLIFLTVCLVHAVRYVSKTADITMMHCVVILLLFVVVAIGVKHTVTHAFNAAITRHMNDIFGQP